jgi:hypothetical protein
VRPALFLPLAAVAGGCSITEVDVGAGWIPRVLVEQVFTPPADEARSSAATRTWTDSVNDEYAIGRTLGEVSISVTRALEFLSQDDSRLFAKEVGGRAGAVDRVDVDVRDLHIYDYSNGLELTPAVLGAHVFVDGTSLGPSGYRGRIPLADASRRRMLSEFAAGDALSLPFGVELTCTPDRVSVLPELVLVRAVLQPILVVQSLDAL